MLVAMAVVALVGLGEGSLGERARPSKLDLRVTVRGEDLVIAWVQPGGPAWDAGVRPGDVVIGLADRAITPRDSPTTVEDAPLVRVRSGAGAERAAVAVAPDVLASPLRRLSFLLLAACFMAIGGLVFVLAADRVVAAIMLGFTLAAATALVAAIATPFGRTWALGVEYVAAVGFAATLFILFLAFPVGRLHNPAGRRLAVGCGGLSALLIALYGWTVTVAPATYVALQSATFAIMLTEILGAMVLAILAFTQTPARQWEIRRALGLVALGTVGGLLPFCLLILGPQVFGGMALVPPDLAILSVGLLPLSLGVAVLSRQFLGITRLVRRGLVALVVWLALLGGYGVGLDALKRVHGMPHNLLTGGAGSTMLIVALVAGTFPPLQHHLRRALEQRLFRDAYDYAGTLERLGTEIARLGGVEVIAAHVLARLGETLDLGWTALALRGNTPPVFLSRWGACPPDLDPLALAASGAVPVRFATGRPDEPQVVPLVADGTTIGALVLGPKRHEGEALPEDRALVATLAPLAATALRGALLARRNALLLERLEGQVQLLAERERELAALGARLLRVQEEERRRLALDLHDDLLQRAILLTREVGEGVGCARTRRWHDALGEIVVALRTTCTDLRPLALDDLGLGAALEWLVGGLRVRSELAVDLTIATTDGTPFVRLPPDLETALYRVAQEALNNTLKHAGATHVGVTLWRDATQVRLSVADDGRGLMPIVAGGDPHLPLGLLGMRERLRPWRGSVNLDPGVAGGAIMTVLVPLEDADA